MGVIDPIAIGSAIPASVVAVVPSWPLPLLLLGAMLTMVAFGVWASATRRQPSERRFRVVQPATAR